MFFLEGKDNINSYLQVNELEEFSSMDLKILVI